MASSGTFGNIAVTEPGRPLFVSLKLSCHQCLREWKWHWCTVCCACYHRKTVKVCRSTGGRHEKKIKFCSVVSHCMQGAVQGTHGAGGNRVQSSKDASGRGQPHTGRGHRHTHPHHCCCCCQPQRFTTTVQQRPSSTPSAPNDTTRRVAVTQGMAFLLPNPETQPVEIYFTSGNSTIDITLLASSVEVVSVRLCECGAQGSLNDSFTNPKDFNSMLLSGSTLHCD